MRTGSGSRRSGLLGPTLRGEEVPHGAPDVVEIVERIAAGGAAGRRQLGEQAPGLRGELPRETGGDLHIAGEASVLRDCRQTLAGVRGVTHRVVAVGGIEEIDVAAARIVAIVDDLPYLGEAGRSHSAAGAAHLEELGLGELPGLGRMGHEHGLEGTVLASQALHYPEEEGLRELAVAVRHAAGDIEKEEDHRMNGGLAPARELPVTQIVVGERRGRAWCASTLDQLLEGPAPVEPGACAAAVPALAHPVG